MFIFFTYKFNLYIELERFQNKVTMRKNPPNGSVFLITFTCLNIKSELRL